MTKYILHEKVLHADLEGVKEIILKNIDLDELDNLGHTALHWAVFGGYYEIVKILLEAGANPNIISEDGVTPIWRAQDFGFTEIENLFIFYNKKLNS